jgi:hypothetical protein
VGACGWRRIDLNSSNRRMRTRMSVVWEGKIGIAYSPLSQSGGHLYLYR